MGAKRKRPKPKAKSAAKKRKRETSELMTMISHLTAEDEQKEWKCINSIRCLGAAQPQNASSGHPGEAKHLSLMDVFVFVHL